MLTGFERVMTRIVGEIDAAPIVRADRWHRSLLQQVAQPMPGRRAAVISKACLDRLRAFRHRERNTYGPDLDFDIILDRSAEAVAAFDVFRGEVRAFFDREAVSDDPERDVPSS